MLPFIGAANSGWPCCQATEFTAPMLYSKPVEDEVCTAKAEAIIRIGEFQTSFSCRMARLCVATLARWC